MTSSRFRTENVSTSIPFQAPAVSAVPAHYSAAMRSCNMWTPQCPVAIERLSLVRCSYIDFRGKIHTDGEIVVLDAVAESVSRIFSTLLELRFPIAKMRSVHTYNGDDDVSMADNNTSCFNFRPIEGTAITSIHSYGLSIDLNPLQNPFVVFNETDGTAQIHPKAGWEFLNRHNRKLGMVEEVVELFAENGFFVWGGRWTTPIDYHHFQTPRGLAELLARTSTADAKMIFEMAKKSRKHLQTMPYGDQLTPVVDLYNEHPQLFFDKLQALFNAAD